MVGKQSGTKSGLYSYLDEYMENIYNRLKEIDILIKSSEEGIDIGDVSRLLGISREEIGRILRAKHLNEINRENFSLVMESGSSRVCQVFRRELEVGAPPVYTCEDIAYIYDIQLSKVYKACNLLNLREITWYTLPALFANIMVES